MGVWKKDPQVDTATVAALQAKIDADPTVIAFRTGVGNRPNFEGGWAKHPNALKDYIEKTYGLPKGYGADQGGQVVYGNSTGWLQKAVMAAAPIAGVSAVGAMAGYGGAALGTDAAITGIPTTITPAVLAQLPAVAGTAAGATAAGTGAAVANAALSGRDYLNLAMFGGRTLTDIVGAKMQSGASDRATAAQVAQQEKALALLREQWQTDQANFKPYLDTGKAALGQLNPALASMQAPGVPPSVAARMGSFGQPTSSAAMPAAWRPDYGTAPMSTSPLAGPPVPINPQMQAQPQQTMADMPVPLQAPDGSVRMIPASRVAYYKQKWASMAPQGAAA